MMFTLKVRPKFDRPSFCIGEKSDVTFKIIYRLKGMGVHNGKL